MGTGEVEEFEAQRRRLFSLAYRLLGSADEAQDVVQDAFLRWDAVDHAAIAVPSAWLTTVVTNLSLTRLTSARARRERYVGPWLPEPVITSDGALGPLDTVEQRHSVSLALLLLMERLTPTERAVFVLREAFGYTYAEIAQILELTPANCRQLQRRATHRLDGHRRFDPDTDAVRALVGRFLAAARDGDMRALERMLAADVTSWADGGGRAPAALRPVVGRDRLLRLFAAVPRRFPDARLEQVEVNGWPGLLGWRAHRLLAVVALDVIGGRITAVRAVSNPDKLRFAAQHVSHPQPVSSHSG